MKPALPLALLFVAACSNDPQPQESDARARAAARAPAPAPDASPKPEPSASPTEAPLMARALADTGPRAAPGELRTFNDWVVGCDNRLFCTAVGLGPEEGGYPQQRVVVMRAGGGASPRVVAESNEGIVPPATIAIDGKPVATGGRAEGETIIFTGEAARRLTDAFVAGEKGSIVAGKREDVLSLAGASAALRYMDERQRIAGTTAALVAKGEARPTASPPAAPEIRRVRPAGRAVQPAPAQVSAMRRFADCQIEFLPEDQIGPQAHALGGGATLILLPCGAGAYNAWSAVFVIGADGTLRPASFDSDWQFDDEAPVRSLVNAGFADGVLVAHARGRGIGDCGIDQRFVWDGRRFRLIEQNEMNECRGSMRTIRSWTARVSD